LLGRSPLISFLLSACLNVGWTVGMTPSRVRECAVPTQDDLFTQLDVATTGSAPSVLLGEYTAPPALGLP
jgi:hypothetical protein